MEHEDEIRFAEEMHGKLHRLLVLIGGERKEKAFALCGELLTMAANRHNGLKMAEEAAAPERFDLAGLAALPMAGPEVGE
jgi:hypothetical protein